jgi:ABC-type glycerol-3-phosphate transport system substrate-binding protein
MKQKVKVVVAFLLVAMLAISAFGCAEPPVNTGILPPDYQLEVEGDVSLLYYIAQTEAEKSSIRDWVANFENKYPDCDVDAQVTVLNKSAVQAMIASKTIADVFFLWETDVYDYAVKQDALMPLDHYVEALNIDTENVFSAILDMGRVDGRMYMVMRDYNHIVLFYNKTLLGKNTDLVDPVELDKAGDWTWDTFTDYCEKLTIKDTDGVTTQVGASLRLGYAPIWIPFVEGFDENNDSKWFNTTKKEINMVGNQDVLNGIQEMIKIIEDGNAIYNPNSGVDGAVAVQREGLPNYRSFEIRTQVVFEDSQFPTLGTAGAAYDQAGQSWDVVSFPALPNHKVGTGATGFAVFNRTSNADAAAALCLSLYTEDGQRAYNGQEGGSVPNVKTLAEDTFWRVPFADASSSDDGSGIYYEAFISHPEADTYGQVECVLPPDIAVIIKEGMANLIPNHINNSMSYENAIAQIQQQANELWATLSYD